MDPPFPDGGQASSYTNPLLPGNGQQASCVSELTATDSYYTLSSTVHEHSPGLSESGSLAPGAIHQCHQSHNTSRYAAMTSNPQYPPRSHQIWPSPPPGPDELENYSYHSSPTCGSAQIYFNPSPISPRTWSSPDQTLQHPVDALQQPHAQDSFESIRICTPTSADEFPIQPSQLSTPYPQSFHQSFEGEPDALLQYQSPVTLQDFSTGTLSCTASPSEPALPSSNSMVVPKIESPLGVPSEAPSPVRQPEPREDSNGVVESLKSEEPYAQLIYKAFMSRPDHTLTLQEIYQWFRDNTDKANKEGKGWQNSIRHNLSMNAAFTKRERKQGSDSDPIVGELALADDSKRSNEWVLEDWAVRDGVQSTTRYRKGTHTRRSTGAGSAKRAHQQTYHHGFQQHGNQISTRSVSGRRGPHGTNKLKLHTRYHGSQRAISPAPNYRIMPHGYPIRRTIFPLPAMNQSHYDDLTPRLQPAPQMLIKAEQNASPLTPDGTVPNSFGSLMPAAAFANHGASVNSNGATYATGGLHQGHMYGPPCEFPYGIADVTGIFQPGHPSAGAVGPRPLEAIHDGLYGWNEDVL